MGWVTIKALGDHQIEAFMRCPYRFYHGWIKGKSTQPEWCMVVQQVVNHIVKEFYSFPQKKRSSLQVLTLVEKYWKAYVRTHIFPTRSQAYITLVKLTDHLLQTMHGLDPKPPLFLYEKFSTYLDELGVSFFSLSKWVSG